MNTPPPTSTFNTECLAQFNLNCLVIFAALYQEKSVTRASERLNIGQPAVSNSLSKLRLVFRTHCFFAETQRWCPPQSPMILRSM